MIRRRKKQYRRERRDGNVNRGRQDKQQETKDNQSRQDKQLETNLSKHGYLRRSRKKGRRNFRWIWRTAVILLVSMSSGILLYACAASHKLPAFIQAQIDILPDRNARQGVLNSGTPQEVQEGEFLVVLNQIPTIAEGDRECNIEFENPAGNHYSARISLYQKTDGRLLGSTKRVDPGSYVESIRLKEMLPAGEHSVFVNLELFEKKKPAGTLGLDITLRVIHLTD